MDLDSQSLLVHSLLSFLSIIINHYKIKIIFGCKSKVVVSNLQSGAQGSFKNGSTWGAIAPGMEYFTIDGNFSLTITQDVLTQLQVGGLIVSGQNYTIESVYIK